MTLVGARPVKKLCNMLAVRRKEEEVVQRLLEAQDRARHAADPA